MNNAKTTKRALLSSVIAMLLCFSMLLGTTFAWFTDSATSAGNKIVAGTLDVKLNMWTSATDSVEITNTSAPIFGSEDSLVAQNSAADTLWEPGKTQVVYLSIENAGSLDLKYMVALEVYGSVNNLHEVMQYSIVPDATYGTVSEWANGIDVTLGTNATSSNDVILKSGEQHYFALLVHMNEDAGNTYMDGEVMFDIKVLAAQLSSEFDSFDDKYDDGATYPSVANKNVTDNSVANTLDTAEGAKVIIPAGAPVGNYSFTVSNYTETTENNLTTLAMDINLSKDGVKVSDDGATTYTVELDIGTGKRVIAVTHNGVSIDDFSYDDATGIISINSRSFSPFTIVTENVREVSGLSGTGSAEDPYLINDYFDLCWFRDHVNTCAADGSSQYNGKYIKLTSDIDLNGVDWQPIGSSTKDHGSFYGNFDGDGHTIYNLNVELSSGQGAAGFFAKVSGGGDGPRAVVKNLVFENVYVSTPDSYSGGVIGNAGGNSEIRNVTVKGDVFVSGYGYVGGIVGHGYPDMYDCHVDANEGSQVTCNYWCGGGMIGYAGEGGTYIEGCSVKGITVFTQYGGFGAIAGLLQTDNTVKDSYAENVTLLSASSYAGGYACGNGEESTYDNVYVKNVTATVNGTDLGDITVDGSGYHNTDNEALIVK